MTILFDGIAYGMLLFLISVGLSVTLGLMNFVNLAHGAFAMVGGYVCVVLLNSYGVPFLATLPVAVVVPALVGMVLERTLYRRLYAASDLDQVLFSLGLVFMAVAGAHYFFGAQQQPLHLPAFLQGQIHLPGLDVGVYRLFLIGVGLVVAFGLQWSVVKTAFGAWPAARATRFQTLSWPRFTARMSSASRSSAAKSSGLGVPPVLTASSQATLRLGSSALRLSGIPAPQPYEPMIAAYLVFGRKALAR